jgi:hypothetical protein
MRSCLPWFDLRHSYGPAVSTFVVELRVALHMQLRRPGLHGIEFLVFLRLARELPLPPLSRFE